MAQLLKWLILGFGSGFDLMGCRFSHQGQSSAVVPCSAGSLLVSPLLPPACVLFKINTKKIL